MQYIKKNIILFLIVLLGILLRLNIDTFSTGYNFDEFAIVSISKLNLFDMIKAIGLEDYHAPLYYVIAHIFSNLENNFILLRLLNIFFSVVNIFVFYKIGKLILNKKTGYLLALFFSVNHLQISITNFIKFYALCILLTSISIYYFVKILKDRNCENKLAIINNFLILSHTFGFVFVVIEYFILYCNKKNIINLTLKTIIGFLIFLPFLIVQARIAIFDSIISPHSTYPGFSAFSIFNFLNDYFTPLLNYSCNTETIEGATLFLNSLKALFDNEKFDFISFNAFLFLSLIPIVFALFGIFKSIKNDLCKKLLFLSLAYFLFFNVLIILEITGFVPLYIFSSGFIFIICAIVGLIKTNNKIATFAICYLIVVQLLITNVYPVEKRKNFNKKFGNIDDYIQKIDNQTPIILFDAARFAKYYYKDKNIITLDYEELKGSHSKEFLKIAFGENEIKKANKKNINEIIKPYILKEKESNNIENFINSKLKNVEKFVLIFNPDGYSFIYSENEMIENIKKSYNYHLENSTIKYQLNKNDKQIGQFELGQIIQTHIIKKINNAIEENYKIIKIEQFKPIHTKGYEFANKISISGVSATDLMEIPIEGWIFVTYQKK